MVRTIFCFVFVHSMLMLHAQTAALSDDVTIIENFNGSFIMSGNPLWKGNAVVTDKSDLPVRHQADFSNDTRFARLTVEEKGTVELILTKFTVREPSILSFQYKTELSNRAGQSFKVYVDDVLHASLEGVGGGWRTERLAVSAGIHTLRFKTENLKGAKIMQGLNAAFVDDVLIFPDKISSIMLVPRGEQHTWVGAAGTAKLRFGAKALLPDGSPKNDVGLFEYHASGGAIDANGLWTPNSTGEFTVTATLDGFSAHSGRLIVHEANILRKPVTYSGTGTTYFGYIGGERAENAAEMPSRDTLIITNPQVADFDADAFFLFEGSVKNPKGGNYARVLVRKKATAQTAHPLETWYLVQGAFSQRIWLPFGTGEYQIEVLEFDKATVTRPPDGEGAFRGGSYTQQPLVFTVNNTREETAAVDGDGRWSYPSFNIQSDDFRVLNLLNHITYGVKGERAIIKAVHDYLVSTLVYDTASFSNAARSRKMDALSVIKNGTAVCDGYTNLSAALLRAAGIPCRVVVNRAIVHSWNQVWADGAWKFYDATWDDPVPDRGPGIVQHTYFLLDALNGGDNRHRGSGHIVLGDVE
ncbi:MAG: transglutaminase domain-containing protein [Spirochaetaceae bacterium]|jgi:transglutaminase-like putative cysteine protease|nr:transglutaminase domain-containing protein [Spirochaetaceae bacterium]